MKLHAEFATADLKIVLISDFHVYDTLSEKELRPSYIRVGDPEGLVGVNPIADLQALIAAEEIRVDMLLCMGDLTDKARPAGVRYGWSKIQELRRQLGAQIVLATSGNHDCDSRYTYTDHDAKGVLQSLVPTYPFEDDILADQYWSRNFFLVEGIEYRIVVLNSSAYHGMGPHEIEHGRISSTTLNRLRTNLENSSERLVNILICHHHPHPHSELGLGVNDLIQGGQQLLDLLGSGMYGKWIIVHGHKHHPKLTYAQGSGSAPLVFACGSLSACLYPELGTNVRNQFHILSVNFAESRKYGFVGRVHTWEWAAGHGWAEAASTGAGLPAVCGFGYRCDPVQLANEVAARVRGARVLWSDIRHHIPELDFILPQEFRALRAKLLSGSGLEILERDGLPCEIGRF